MDIDVKIGDITGEKAEVVVVNLFEGVKKPGGATGAVDSVLNKKISYLVSRGEIKGKLNEITLIHTDNLPFKHVVCVGLGKTEEFDLDKVRQVSATVAKYIKKIGVSSFSTIIHGAGIGGLDTGEAAQALVEGAVLGLYQFNRYKKNKKGEIKKILIVEKSNKKISDIKKAVSKGKVIAKSQCFARDIINLPSNELTPTILSRYAKDIAKGLKLKCEVLDERECRKIGMNTFLAVAKGSDEPAKFIILKYEGGKSKKDNIVIVGKGITFDSGGISLKPSMGMGGMKTDMAGAGVCLAVVRACALLKLPVNLIALLPATENLPSGKATKPGDIIKSLSGKTVEIANTDAEGRLILADALYYAKKYNPKIVIDVATLTGAASVVVGKFRCAVMGNNKGFMDKLKSVSVKTGEKVWDLPLDKEYRSLIDSDVADMKNIGDRTAGTIVGGIFLKEFVDDMPWIHIDIASVDIENQGRPYIPKGATAFGVRLLTEFISSISA